MLKSASDTNARQSPTFPRPGGPPGKPSLPEGIAHALDCIGDFLFVLDEKWRFVYLNQPALDQAGKPVGELLGWSLWEAYPELLGTALEDHYRKAMATRMAVHFEMRGVHTGRCYEVQAMPCPEGLAVYSRDVTERKRAEGLLAVQLKVLERISTDASLGEVLEVLARGIEEQAPGMLCSVLLLDEAHGTLHDGAGPSLPAEYRRAVDGIAIGPCVGSCGTAAYTGKMVIVEDIAVDPLWAAFREAVSAYQLRACWSTPIRAPGGKILGTFAMYYRHPCRPNDHELRLIEVSSHLAAMAIERKRAAEALRDSEARFQAFMDTSPAVAWMKDEQLRYVYVNRTWEKRFDRKLETIRGQTGLNERPPEVGEELRRHDQAVLASGQTQEFEELVPDAEGRTCHWQVYKFPFHDATGNQYVGGIALDITGRKQAEANLRAYAERLEALSRRVLEVQEQERRSLARELHDEIGQILTGLQLTLKAAQQDPPDNAHTGLQNAQIIVSELLSQVRELSLHLRPSILDDFGLLPALTTHLERYAKQTGIQVAFTHHGLAGRFPAEVETAAYRIVQESLTNVARHAKVHQAEARVAHYGGHLTIEVRDRGTGFDVARAASTGGLSSMQERVALLGGRLVIESRVGRGTLVAAELPLQGHPL
jgi:PAS domain S-box-containing protein